MIELPYLTEHAPFPSVSEALSEPNGLLAFGGTLDINRLFNAYSNGIFPWFSEQEPILWWSPDPRAIIDLDCFHLSRSLAKLSRQKRYQVTLNQNFGAVIRACATISRLNPHTQQVSQETWITKDMQHAYFELHQAGLAHSVEVWDESTLVGGLYGVAVGKVFCGESMFHHRTNASKLAMYALVTHMKAHNLAFIDCQLPTDHLASMGATPIPREEFIVRLKANNLTLDSGGHILSEYRHCWCPQEITP
ncbi:leucyl/phenylalanyl-tRNA--protein transferase [Alteromonas aestuariivivens]|uniref:Leucyl/phenylalanyl-tRNA--protein transferase n=1 Tax=Alteromonas aestuariivivens TaxID=1938339 RepID=A0A3D8M8L5_9ALTE|nr:leucyl/phenylalanyl-tRNA--protein transferase [Alteromonas aestuariivivens]RDV26164.1 leucyl/phenylalanyl-tRNA--protein transferase [Alteromonas aestuariivivens]